MRALLVLGALTATGCYCSHTRSDADAATDASPRDAVAPPDAPERALGCDLDAPRGAGNAGALVDSSECETDAECTEGPIGRCLLVVRGLARCSYHECASDDDCAPGEACACGAGARAAHVCLPADCRTSDDCGGWPCGVEYGCGGTEDFYLGYGAQRLVCHEPGDACFSSAECTAGDDCRREGLHGGEGRFECRPISCGP